MKKASLIFCCILSCLFSAVAQKPQPAETFQVNAWIPSEDKTIPEGSKIVLQNKLKQLIIANNFVSGEGISRFLLVPVATFEDKVIAPTVPAQIVATINFQLYIGDGMEGKQFSAFRQTVKSVGTDETRAFNSAINDLDFDTPEFKLFLKNGKEKALSYYTQNCQQIIKRASQLATNKQYDEALFTIATIPSECTDCWSQANAQLKIIFKQKIDYEGRIKMTQAKGIWAAKQNSENGERAAEILITIDPDASCYNEAGDLLDAIAKSVKEHSDNEWKYKMELPLKLESDRVAAMKEIGIAWGQNQPQNVTYKSFW